MPTYEDELASVAADCELKLKFSEEGFSVREIIPPATTLYDPMLGWVDEDDSLVFCDIGGQAGGSGWDPRSGHGSIWRLYPDDRIEAVVPPGAIGKGMVMFPMKSPVSFGPYGGEVFFLGQLKPGRPGAHNTHAVYWVPPGWDTPEVFCVVPHAGCIGGGISGALCPAGWGEDGTPEEGVLFVVSLMNCVVYRVTPDRRISPWLICDEDTVGYQFMPSRVFRAGPSWGRLAGELIVAGRPNTSFEKQAQLSDRLQIGFWCVIDPGGTPRLEVIESPPDVGAGQLLPTRGSQTVAPEGFGPFGGQRFMCTPGSANLAHTTRLEGALPYDASIVRTDASDQVHEFATRLQSGSPALLFQGSRMVVAVVRKSYSTGEYHLPDGSLYEIMYTG